MNAVLQAAIDAGLAEIEQVVAIPSEPFVYGSDLALVYDFDGTMRELDGDDPLVVVEAIARRIDCPRGALGDDPNYGVSVVAMLNRGTTAAEIQAIAGRIRAEVLADDRIDSATVKVTPSATGSELAVEITGVLRDSTAHQFSLVFAVTSAAVVFQELAVA